MKKCFTLILSVTCAIFVALTLVTPSGAYAQKKAPVLKIGTYDSRIVVFAWSRSDHFKQLMIKTGLQDDSAKKSHDTARIKELSVGRMSYQHLLHQMVFSNGSAGSVMILINDKLPELARTYGVGVILSKWEADFIDHSIEIVDLTDQVAQLFKPRENISKMAAEIRKQEPVPIDDLSIETEMLDGYCKKFGVK